MPGSVWGYLEAAERFFLSTGRRFPRRVVWAMGVVKASAALANLELGLLDEARGRAIVEAAREVARGLHDDSIVVDVYQTGSGTGLNFNVNLVIARRASELAGVEVHPLDHVNKGQSSNDVVPTAARLAAARAALEAAEALEALADTLEARAAEECATVKPGRTHLRDALPVTLGQELQAHAKALHWNLQALKHAAREALRVPLGGTAVGTGANTHPDHPRLAIKHLRRETGLPVEQAQPPAAKMANATDLLNISAAHRSLALTLTRLSQDLRLLYSGPNTAIAEVDLPQDIPGSTAMPGKKNPVTLEAAMQATAHITGIDAALAHAQHLGELELALAWPLHATLLDEQATLLTHTARKLAMIIRGLKPDKQRMERLARASTALTATLTPLLGYEKTQKITELLQQGHTLQQALQKLGTPPEEKTKLQTIIEQAIQQAKQANCNAYKSSKL